MKLQILILLLFISLSVSAQTLPRGANLIDASQRRQGDWIIWMNSQWQPINDSTEAVYYRSITYQDDKPVGITTDYYRNGSKQFQGTLLEDRPQDVLEGVQTWFYSSGEKRIIEMYVNGESKGEKVLLRSGEPANENWIVQYYRQGEKFSDEKNYEASAQEFLKAIKNAEAFFGRESEEYAAVADWLGIVFGLSSNRIESIYYKEEFVSVRRLVHSQPDTLMLNALEDLGSYYRLENNFVMAKKRLKEFLNLNARYFYGNHPNFPTGIQTLGSVSEALHEYDNALTYLTDAKRIFDADPKKYEYPRLSNVFSLSGLYLTIGELTKGEQLLTNELKQQKKTYGEKSEIYRTALGLLARIHVGAAKYKQAEAEWKEVLRLIENTQSENYAQALGSLAELNVAKGDIAQADNYIGQALKIYERQPTPDASYLEFLAKLSSIYAAMGNRQALLQTAQLRKTVAEKLFGNQSLEYARTLLLLSDVTFLNKNWTQCEAFIKEAFGIYAKYNFNTLGDAEKINLALLKSRLGSMQLMQYLSTPEKLKLTSAEQNLKEAIAIFEGLPKKIFSSNITDTYLMMATVFELNGNEKEADRYYNFIYDNVKKQWGETHPYLINVLFLIAKKSEIRKKYAASLDYYKKAIALHQKYIQDVFPYLSEIEKEQFYESNKDMITGFQGFAAQYHQQLPGLAAIWCNVVLNQKGIILHSFNPIRDAIYNSGDPSIKNLFNRWQHEKNEFGKLLQDETADKAIISAKSNQLNELEKELSVTAKKMNLVFKYSNGDWKDVQKILNVNEAAVEIVYTILDRDEGRDSAYYALVIKSGMKEPEVIRLVAASKAERKSFKFYRNSIKLQQPDLVSYGIYWQPLEKIMDGVSTVYVSADGIFHQLNFSTLFNPETKKYVQEEKLIRSVPSVSWLLDRETDRSGLTQVILFAHPNYGSTVTEKKTDLTRSLDLDNINDLPGTQRELSELASLLDASKIKYTAYEGAAATEDQIKKIKSPEVLHIATHGYFLSKGATTNDKFQNPLLQSGLLLAGCQKNSQQDDLQKEDGILTAFEASTLPLYQTKLVVMSACETGLGEVKNGEGVYGLQRAFFMAGAQQLLMSLWKVDDEATQLFMVEFYKKWIQNKDSNQAFRQAQHSVKAKYPAPFYWGAFILNGK